MLVNILILAVTVVSKSLNVEQANFPTCASQQIEVKMFVMDDTITSVQHFGVDGKLVLATDDSDKIYRSTDYG
jgi:hypothetical protein